MDEKEEEERSSDGRWWLLSYKEQKGKPIEAVPLAPGRYLFKKKPVKLPMTTVRLTGQL
eukprot:COSAG02_NODE_12703_length_1507_cov_0.905540_1_plen_59_part_00